MTKGTAFCIGAVIVLCSWFWFRNSNSESPQTLGEYTAGIIRKINNDLRNPANKVKKYIEDAHATVTVTSLQVTKCHASSIDGTDNAGIKGSNIGRVNMEITARWDGAIHKGGYTVVHIEYVSRDGKLLPVNTQIIDTNALVNTYDPDFWLAVGTTLLLVL